MFTRKQLGLDKRCEHATDAVEITVNGGSFNATASSCRVILTNQRFCNLKSTRIVGNPAKISNLLRFIRPCSSCLPFKFHQSCISSDRCRLSVGFDNHSLVWWLNWVCFSKATASLFLSNFLRIRFPLRPAGLMSTFISTIIEFLNSHKKTLRWVRLPFGLNALQLCDEYFSTNNRHLKCM